MASPDLCFQVDLNKVLNHVSSKLLCKRIKYLSFESFYYLLFISFTDRRALNHH